MAFSVDSFVKSYNQYIDNINASLDSEKEMRDQVINEMYEPIVKAQKAGNYDEVKRIHDIFAAKYRYIKDLMPCYFSNFKKRKDKATKQQINDTYLSLKGQFKSFEILSNLRLNETFYWQSNITIHHSDPANNSSFELDLGIFKFYFLELENGEYSIKAEPIGNNKMTAGGSYHPHIQQRSGKVCIGSYEGTIKEDMANSNILKIAESITSVLCNYNASSVWSEDVSAWIGHKCPVCFQFVPIGSKTAKCAKRMEIMHESCAVAHNGRLYNPILLKKCNVCGKDNVSWIVKNNSITCEECL